MKPSQKHLPTIIMIAGGLILILWIASDPIPAMPVGRQARSSEPQLNFLPPVKPVNETCRECHGNPERLKTDMKDPSCLECHSAVPAGRQADDPLYPSENSMEGDEPVPLLSHPALPALPVPCLPARLGQADGRQVVKPVSMKGSPSLPQSTEMIFIPPGSFLMGSNSRTNVEGSGDADEAPLHKAHLDGYHMDKYEVTNAQYKAFMDATGRRPPKHWNGNSPPPGKENHPVIYVDWFEANDFCHWVGKRLPTEEEWEIAARGQEGLRFPWGDAFDPMKANTPQHWLAMNRPADTTPVGSFPKGKSPYGLYDMAGNVYEWTSSWYKPYPNNRVFNVHYGEKNKIVRGGSWYDCLSYGCGLSAPTFNRSRFAPAIRNKSFGFRCAKSQE